MIDTLGETVASSTIEGLEMMHWADVVDILAAQILVECRANVAHKRAKLLTVANAGMKAIARLGDDRHRWAKTTAATLRSADLRACLNGSRRVAKHLHCEEAAKPDVGTTEDGSSAAFGRSA